MKLLAVDGNSVINRSYYGIRMMSARDGFPTNGIYGFLTTLLRMQQDTAPDAIAITFDTRAPTFRHKQFDGYKATRKGMPDDLAQQMPVLEELLTYLGYKIIKLEGYEADDLLGTLAKMCCDNGGECVIATGDRDSFQLINECVTVRLASTKAGSPVVEFFDIPGIAEKYMGIAPRQLIEVKALMGDSSDNIPGVAGIGEKTALSLISRFNTIDAIYNDLEALDIKDRVREQLRTGKEMAYMSRMLAEIDQNAPINIKPEDCLKNPVDNVKAYQLMARLEFFSLMEKFGIRPEKLRGDETSAHEPERDDGNTSSGLEIIFTEMLPEELLEEGKTVDVLFSPEGGGFSALCVIDDQKVYLIESGANEAAKKILTSSCEKRVNHVKHLHRFALTNGFEVRNIVFDAEIAAYILNPAANDYGLGKLAAEYGVTPTGFENIFGVHGELLNGCAIFPELADTLTAAIKKLGMEMLFYDIELPLARVLADMEHLGFTIDSEGLSSFGEKLEHEAGRLQTEIHALAGKIFNINSPKQLGEVLFGELKIPSGKKTKTKSGYSTNADVLEPLADEYEIVAKILEYRKVAKLKSTYADGLLKVVGDDGRIHTSFQQTLTRTGRISSIEPNMQNIPVRTELGSELRRFFRAGEGKVLLDADYSQIELRVLAHIADDINMIGAFSRGEDIHLNTASQVFDMPPMFVTPLMRSRAKAVNFGIVYGIGAFSLSKDIGVSVSEADAYIKSYLATYSGVKKYMEDTVASATENGYVSTLFGRRRYLPELASSNRQNREFGKRVAMNTPIQGTAADIIKIAMVRVFNRLKQEGLNARLILQVHDELIVECPESEISAASAVLREEMENAAKLSVPMEAEVGSGQTWLDAK